MNKTNSYKLILITPIFFLLGHYLTMLPHEYMHSLTAWALGYKANPFNLNYGGNSRLNILLLLNMDEHVNYDMIFAAGHLMNLGNFYDYVPIRTFTTHGDVANFMNGLHISPWWIYIFGGYIVAYLIWYFFSRTLIAAYHHLSLNTPMRAFLMIICVLILMGFFGSPGLLDYGDISFFLSATSLIVIPGMMAVLWPTREWSVQAVNTHK